MFLRELIVFDKYNELSFLEVEECGVIWRGVHVNSEISQQMDLKAGNSAVTMNESGIWPWLLSLSVTAYWERSVIPLTNMVTNSAMSSALDPLRVKSPFSVSRHTAWPDALPSLHNTIEPISSAALNISKKLVSLWIPIRRSCTLWCGLQWPLERRAPAAFSPSHPGM